MRTIGIVTVGRSDFGMYTPILRKLQMDGDLQIQLIAGGMHWSKEHGLTANLIEKEGFHIDERVVMEATSDKPEGIATSMGQGTIGFAKVYARLRLDLLLVLGDRFEMHSAVVAALPFLIPVAHIGGGELTEGAIDDSFRHSISKMSHLHFVAAPEYRSRLLRMGEEPWRVVVSGTPSLDHLRTLQFLSADVLQGTFHLKWNRPPLLVTFHPVTLEYERTVWQLDELLAALEVIHLPLVFTYPNADTHYRVVAEKIRQFVKGHPGRACAVVNFGTQAYFSMMKLAAAMVGNSSSGVIEAPSLGLPVVNIGTRQKGRLRAANVIDVGYERDKIVQGIHQATSPQFRRSLEGLRNPLGDGRASDIISQHLKTVPLNEKLLVKHFYDEAKRPEPVVAEGSSR